MKVKVSEASGIVLDLMVAKAKKLHKAELRLAPRQFAKDWADGKHNYSTMWSQGGPIIEAKIDCLRKRSKAEEASLAFPSPNFKFKAEIFADINGYFCAFGPTPLIAGLRCSVMSELGEIVEVPDALT